MPIKKIIDNRIKPFEDTGLNIQPLLQSNRKKFKVTII